MFKVFVLAGGAALHRNRNKVCSCCLARRTCGCRRRISEWVSVSFCLFVPVPRSCSCPCGEVFVSFCSFVTLYSSCSCPCGAVFVFVVGAGVRGAFSFCGVGVVPLWVRSRVLSPPPLWFVRFLFFLYTAAEPP